MRKIANYTITKELIQDMIDAQRFNPCLEITFRDRSGKHTHKISAGYDDDICVYRENKETYVLCQNMRIGYIGLEVFKGEEKIDDLFLQGHEVAEVIGNRNLADFTIIKRMRDCMY